MGVSIKYVSRKRRETALRRAVWDFVEMEVDQELDFAVANVVVQRMCEILRFVVEDMKTVGELNRAGSRRRHWYTLELNIGEDKINVQNILEGAGSSPPHPPTRAQQWLCLDIPSAMAFRLN